MHIITIQTWKKSNFQLIFFISDTKTFLEFGFRN